MKNQKAFATRTSMRVPYRVFVAVVVLLGTGLFGAPDLQAQILYYNAISSSSPYSSNPYTSGDVLGANITGYGIGRGSGISGNAGSGRYNAKGWTTSSTTPASSDYFYIRFAADAGYSMDITDIYLETKKSGTGPRSFVIRSSEDNFTSDLYTYSTTSTSNRSHSISIPSNKLKEIKGTFEIRIYAYYASGSSGTFSVNYHYFFGTTKLAAPVLNSLSATNIGSSTADFSANLASNGGLTIAERGFVWSTSNNPEVGDAGATKVVAGGTGTGTFNSAVTGLPAGTQIYYRAFAKESGAGYYYSTASSFYTLSTEPAAFPITFSATTQSKNSIRLDWTQVNDADGYLILQRTYDPPSGVPSDATSYSTNQSLGNATVIGIISDKTITTLTVNNLLQGTRFHYSLFPYSFNGSESATYNYKTDSPYPTATDSTWGRPTSLSSTILTAGGEASFIPSVRNEAVNASGDGVQVWNLRLADGGNTLSDDDDLPTIITSLTIRKGNYNTVSNWSTAIQEVALFDDSTGALLAKGSVSSSQISFTGFTATAADDTYRPLSIRLTLEKRAHTDNSLFHFQVDDADIATEGLLTSSQKMSFDIHSDSSKNPIQVLATKLKFLNQPPSSIEAGVPYGTTVRVIALDTFDGIDMDFASPVYLTTSASNLIAAPRSDTPSQAIVEFDTLRFHTYSLSDTLIAYSAGLYDARSNAFEVFNSLHSDIIINPGFSPQSDILHLLYNDDAAVTANNSVEVAEFWLRDGGPIQDEDFEPTVLNALTFDVESGYLIRRAALFQGNTNLMETDTVFHIGNKDQLLFTGLSLMANDNDSVKFSLRITFEDSAVDGDRIVVLVSDAVSAPDHSSFQSNDAGAAISSTLNNENRIDVVAHKLAFVKQASDVRRGSIMNPFVGVAALDSLNNIDLETRQINLSVTGSSFTSTALTNSGTGTDGNAYFPRLLFTTVSNNVTLTAYSGQLDTVVSDIFQVLDPVWYRSVATGNWSDTLIWEWSENYGGSWTPASVAPNFDKHGQITIRTGDTVYMDGTTQTENTLDETIIEAGALLVTPEVPKQKLVVNDAIGTDLVIEGALLHNNDLSLGGIRIVGNGRVEVETGGSIELASFGNASRWAGNQKIFFDSGAYYIHNTGLPGTLGDGVMFPNAGQSDIPVFVIKDAVSFPGKQSNPAAWLNINGILEVETGDTLKTTKQAVVAVRDGIRGDGVLVARGEGEIRLTGQNSFLTGNGAIVLNDDAAFVIAATADAELRMDHTIQATANGQVEIRGTWNAADHEILGNAPVSTYTGSRVISAHTAGLDGSFNTTGSRNYNAGTHFVFNGNTAQQSGQIPSGVCATLTVDNTAGLTLESSLEVNDSLELVAGKVEVVSGETLFIAQNAEIHNASSSRFIDGNLSIYLLSGDSAEFPVGDGNDFAPVSFLNQAANPGYVSLEYRAENPDNAGYSTGSLSSGLMSILSQEYWLIDAESGSVRIAYTANSGVSGYPLQDIRVAAWNGASWVSEGPLSRNATATEIGSDILKNYSVLSIGVDSTCTTPAAAAFVANTVCVGDNVTLQANGNGDLNWFVRANDPMPFATADSVIMGVLPADTVFYVEVQKNGCVSPRVAYPVTVNAIPAQPSVSGSTEVCYNTSVDLNAPAGGSYEWFADANGTALLASGTSFSSTALTNDTFFFVREVVNTCYSALSRIEVQTYDSVVAPVSLIESICGGLQVSWNLSQSNDVLWYADLTSTNPIYQGAGFVTDTLYSDTLFYAQSLNSKGCVSRKVKMEVQVKAQPVAPAAMSAEICEGESAVLTTAASTGTTVYWYSSSGTQAMLDTGDSYTTPLLFASGVYYASAYNGACHSARVSFPVSVNAIPADFSIITPGGISGAQNATIMTDAAADNYSWDFGAGATPQTATGQGPHNVVWNTSGLKTIELKVWNGDEAKGCAKQIQKVVFVDPGTGVREAGDASFSLYPNPASDQVKIDLGGTTANATVTIYDARGRQVHSGLLSESGVVNLNGWKPGIYLVKVEAGGRQTSARLIVR